MPERQSTPPNPADVAGSLQYALGLHQQGRLGDAENIYNDILRAQPRQLDALHLLGLLKFQQREHAEAERLIAAALQVEPNMPVLLTNYGRVLEALGRREDALASYDRALAFSPDNVDALFNRGNALHALNRPAEAVASYVRALTLNPKHVQANYNCGIALQALNRLADSLASLEKALALNPAHVGGRAQQSRQSACNARTA